MREACLRGGCRPEAPALQAADEAFVAARRGILTTSSGSSTCEERSVDLPISNDPELADRWNRTRFRDRHRARDLLPEIVHLLRQGRRCGSSAHEYRTPATFLHLRDVDAPADGRDRVPAVGSPVGKRTIGVHRVN
jgi:hypothetical protein